MNPAGGNKVWKILHFSLSSQKSERIKINSHTLDILQTK